MAPQLYTYDGSFEGLLTVVFEAYERKVWPTAIEQEHLAQPLMFGETIAVTTDEAKAARVWAGLRKKLSAKAQQAIYHTYLWEQSGFEMLIFGYTRLVFGSSESIEGNFTAECVLQVQQISKQVHREKHRMEAFVRFQKTLDDIYYAVISPDYDVIPLIITHFQKRYADQRWVIYDTRRQYGAYYNLTDTSLVQLHTPGGSAPKWGNLAIAGFAPDEEAYQQLWQVYFKHVTIQERRNPKLHLRHMPRRYWKYLSEKQQSPRERKN